MQAQRRYVPGCRRRQLTPLLSCCCRRIQSRLWRGGSFPLSASSMVLKEGRYHKTPTPCRMAPPRCSGRTPALPYPPWRQGQLYRSMQAVQSGKLKALQHTTRAEYSLQGVCSTPSAGGGKAINSRRIATDFGLILPFLCALKEERELHIGRIARIPVCRQSHFIPAAVWRGRRRSRRP